jgi:dolichyl-phosphate-mannose--protein O-mannosyl transferase
MGRVRGIRFSDKEEARIKEFLFKNPLLDFSTLAKVAIFEFIKNPQIKLIPIEKALEQEDDDVRPVQ